MRKRKSRAQISLAVGLIVLALIILIGGRLLSSHLGQKPNTVIQDIEIISDTGEEVKVLTE